MVQEWNGGGRVGRMREGAVRDILSEGVAGRAGMDLHHAAHADADEVLGSGTACRRRGGAAAV
jgi:hypothetical protein